MKKVLRIFVMLMLLMPLTAMAQPKGKGPKGKGNRTEWMQKMKEFKHSFLIKELDLSEKQAADFFRVYDAREKERFEAEGKLRRLERTVAEKGDKATDAELDEVIEAQSKFQSTMANIDAKYEPQFRKLLSKRQLSKLPHAEREFQRMLMDKRNDCPPPPQPKQ